LLQEKSVPVGVEIVSVTLSELNYAPEIASAMLKKQQAAARIAARELIVDGA
jgi:regulator of protease activity HflC (stomatin/prohibitin superfamily)